MVDVIVDIDSLQIILEMNRNSGIWQNEKNFSYACKVYTDHMRRGDTYEDATPIILIDFNYQCGDNDKLISNYQLRIDNGNNVYTEKMKIYSVRIDKLRIFLIVKVRDWRSAL